jgi:hypothetical protein
MADASDWNSGVLPHQPLGELAPGLWSATGTIPGMPLRRNMVVAKLPDGRLWLHSVVALGDADMAKLEALGDVAFLVAPGPGHRIDIARFHARYPKAKVLAPGAARAKIEEKCPVDASCEEGLAAVSGVRALPIPGMPNELAYEIDAGDGSGGKYLILNDLLGSGKPPPGLGGWLFGLLGTPGGALGIARIVSLLQVKDKAATRAWIAEQGRRADLRALTISHGAPVTSDVGPALAAAAAL